MDLELKLAAGGTCVRDGAGKNLRAKNGTSTFCRSCESADSFVRLDNSSKQDEYESADEDAGWKLGL